MARDSENGKRWNWWGRHSHIDKSLETHVIKSEQYPRINGISFKLYSRSMVRMDFHFLKITISDGGGRQLEEGQEWRIGDQLGNYLIVSWER